jgi:hypothetical protein
MQEPEKGFYYHYKHDSVKGINDYAYEVVAIGKSSEVETEKFVIYRPIRESEYYENGKYYGVRPLEMFMDKNFEKDGKIIPERFIKITDEKVISELIKIRDEMYK